MIREASLSSKWEQMQKHITRNYVESLSGWSSIRSLSSELENPLKDRYERLSESERMKNTRRPRLFESSIQGIYWFTKTEVSVLFVF